MSALAPAAGTLTPERWERVKALFDAALEHTADERAAFVATASGGDAWVEREVASLLASHDEDVAFLEVSPADLARRADEDDAEALAGRRVGPYRIVREVGRGGMGSVFLAERDDDAYRQRVALKLIKRGMDTDLLVRRFRHERQILASLAHPHIARLLDGGTTDEGLPYFVMEYVEGEPIDQFCARRGLSAAARLGLFRRVCEAVHFAHQRLVVHRDLKPGNVLVTADGTPKLLDFGLAKLLESGEEGPADSTLAGAGLRAMTPEYASPEQVRGAAVSTLSDVYSLGVLLHELLTGRRPYAFASRSPEEVARVVGAHDAERLTAREPALRGDLATVVAMAMRPEPARRYASAEQLADDVRRYLERRPVLARRDTFGYRAGKFVRRNRLGVTAAALVLLSLVGGLAAATWQARVARAERAIADQRFGEVRRLANSLLFELHDAVAPLAGSTPARELVVRRALEYLGGLAGEERSLDPALALELSAAYARVGEIQGNEYFSNLGQTAAAESSYVAALRLANGALAEAPDGTAGDTLARFAVSTAHVGVGDMHNAAGRLRDAVASYQRAEAIRAELVRADPQHHDYRRKLATVRVRLGDVTGNDGYQNLGDAAGARAYYAQAVADYERVLAAQPNDDDLRGIYAGVLTHQAMVAGTLGDDSAALAADERAVRTLEGLVARNPMNADYRIQLVAAYGALRGDYSWAGARDSALAVGKRMVTLGAAVAAADPTNAVAARNLAVGLRGHGRDLLAAGRVAEALAVNRRSFAITDSLLAAEPASLSRRGDVAFSAMLFGEAQLAAGDASGALASYRRAAAITAAQRAADTTDFSAIDNHLVARGGVGNARRALGDAAGAVRDLEASVAMAERVSARTPDNVGRRTRVARQLVYLSAAYTQAGRRADACSAFARANAVLTVLGAVGPRAHSWAVPPAALGRC